MNDVIPFEFEGRKIRVLMIDGMPWWVAVDVCHALGLTNVSKALEGLEMAETKTLTISEGLRNQGLSENNIGTELNVINESGYNRLIFSSRKPAAKRLQKKTFGEILPSIRKTGIYVAPDATVPGIEAMDARTLFKAAAERILNENEQLADAMTAEHKKVLLLTNEKLENSDQIQQYKALVDDLIAQIKRDADIKYGMWNNAKKKIGNISQRKLFEDPKITRLPPQKKDGTAGENDL